MTSLWLPQSTCGTACLPAPSRQVSRWTVARRIVVTSAVLFGAVLASPVLVLLPEARLRRAQRAISRGLLRGLGVEHRVKGTLPVSGALIVANHVSWLDVIVLLAHAPARLLAKGEVRRWPLIGRLATTMGTVFIERTRPKTLPATVAAVRDDLAAGGVVAVFPEGTTWCGRRSGPFRPAMFQAAVDAGVPVVPVRLSFATAGVPSTVAAFIGEQTLVESLRAVLTSRGLSVALRVHPRLHPGPQASRRALAGAAHAVVRAEPAAHPDAVVLPVRPTVVPKLSVA